MSEQTKENSDNFILDCLNESLRQRWTYKHKVPHEFIVDLLADISGIEIKDNAIFLSRLFNALMCPVTDDDVPIWDNAVSFYTALRICDINGLSNGYPDKAKVHIDKTTTILNQLLWLKSVCAGKPLMLIMDRHHVSADIRNDLMRSMSYIYGISVIGYSYDMMLDLSSYSVMPNGDRILHSESGRHSHRMESSAGRKDVVECHDLESLPSFDKSSSEGYFVSYVVGTEVAGDDKENIYKEATLSTVVSRSTLYTINSLLFRALQSSREKRSCVINVDSTNPEIKGALKHIRIYPNIEFTHNDLKGLTEPGSKPYDEVYIIDTHKDKTIDSELEILRNSSMMQSAKVFRN